MGWKLASMSEWHRSLCLFSLKVWWLLPFLFIFYFSVSYIYNHIHAVHSFSTFISIFRGLSPFLHCLFLRGKNLFGPTCELGPALQQASTLPTELRCTLLSYAAPYRATLHLTELCFTQNELRCTPTEQRCTPLSYAAPYWATLHIIELRCTLLSYAALYWATLHLTELRCTLLSYTAPYWATLHPKWATKHPNWATLHPIWATLLV